jgi:hypothetical protein
MLRVVSSACIHHPKIDITEHFRFGQKAAENLDLINPQEKFRLAVHLLYSL